MVQGIFFKELLSESSLKIPQYFLVTSKKFREKNYEFTLKNVTMRKPIRLSTPKFAHTKKKLPHRSN